MEASTDPGWPRLVHAVQRAFAGSPYHVAASDERIVVQADLADARFLAIGGARAVRSVFRSELRPAGPGRVAWTDASEDVEWSAGVDGRMQPRLSGRIRAFRGRSVSVSFRRELGVDANGLGAPVDYRFATTEISQPLAAAVREAGFRRRMDAATRIGLVAAVVGGGGAVVAGIVVAVLAATGSLPS